MPKYLAEIILEIDPTADVERVGDIADALPMADENAITTAQLALGKLSS